MSEAKTAKAKTEEIDLTELAMQMQGQRKLIRVAMESKIEETIEIVKELRKKGMINRNGSFQIQDNLIQLLAHLETI